MNINELKNRLQTLNRRTNQPKDIWKPKDEHDVRLLKNPKSDDPFQERVFHFNIGDNPSILCPKGNFEEECAICDFADSLRGWKDDKGRDKPEKLRKEDFEIFKKIQAVSKVYVPMVERAEDGKTTSEPKWWGLTPNQAQAVLKVCLDADRLRECGIDPVDTDRAIEAVVASEKAFDLHVSFKKPGEKGNAKTFTQVDIEPKYKPSPLTGNKTKDAELLGKIKPLSEVFEKVTSSEVEKALKKFVGDGAKPSKPEGGDEKYEGKNRKAAEKNSNEDAKKVGKRSIEEAFAETVGEPPASP